jgi:glutamine amidotransferase
MITIVDYGIGNFGSMLNMFKRIGVSASVEGDPALIGQAKKLILPGVGAFDSVMNRINSVPGLRDILEFKAKDECIPVLGVCLGMQLLTRSSEEGKLPGLGWIPGTTSQVGDEPHYYFVHSYCVHVDDPAHSLMKTHYGIEFDSVIGLDNIYGVQFHPEKSHRFGMQILKNFAKL